MTNRVIFFDGYCVLCNSSVDFLISRDKRDNFRFASLQSDKAAKILSEFDIDPNIIVNPDVNTIYKVPALFFNQNIVSIICNKLLLQNTTPDISFLHNIYNYQFNNIIKIEHPKFYFKTAEWAKIKALPTGGAASAGSRILYAYG